MLIVRTTKARQSNLQNAGTILRFTAGFGCKPPEIYPASTEPYRARINNRVVIYIARRTRDSHKMDIRSALAACDYFPSGQMHNTPGLVSHLTELSAADLSQYGPDAVV